MTAGLKKLETELAVLIDEWGLETVEKVMDRFHAQRRHKVTADQRTIQIRKLLLEGMGEREIATRLQISVLTAQHYIRDLREYRKPEEGYPISKCVGWRFEKEMKRRGMTFEALIEEYEDIDKYLADLQTKTPR